MNLLQPLGKGQGFLKAGFLGFQKSGKTFTACLLAVAVKRRFKLSGPIVFLDTENASEYVAPLVKSLTGQDLLGVRTRKFDDLLAAAGEAESIGAACLIADSMTHFWRSLCDSYLAGVNATRRRYNKPPRMKLEFQDWGQVKGQWANWTDRFLNAPLHMIICGRAGYEYDMERNEETGKNELIKTGVKMKTEAEFGFEPSLLVQMDSEQEPDPTHPGRFRLLRTASVIGDRYGVIDGKVFGFRGVDSDRKAELAAVDAAFGPHLDMLVPGAHSVVPTEAGNLEVNEDGDVEFARERKARTILAEEIQGAIVSAIPGQSADDKKRKADLLMSVFGTRSWSAVENMPSERLREGLSKIRAAVGEAPPAPAPASAPAPAPAPAPQAKPKSQPEPPDELPMGDPPPAPAPAPAPTGAASTDVWNAIGSTNVAAAVSWMIRNGWLTSEQSMSEDPFCHLTPERSAKVTARPDAFLRAIGTKR